MKKFLLISGGVIVVMLLLLVSVVAYLGFVPGLSDKMVKRVDLGIENDPQLSYDMREDLELTVNFPEAELPTSKTVLYEGATEVEESLTSEQITSILNLVKEELAYMPFSNVQIRLNEDGTTEASFDLDIETTVNEAKKLGYSDEEIEKGKKYVGALGDSVYMYAKFSFGMQNNELTVDPSTFRIQNFKVPSGITKMVAEVGSDAIEQRLSQVSNLDVRSIEQEGTKLNFSGTIPNTASLAE